MKEVFVAGLDSSKSIRGCILNNLCICCQRLALLELHSILWTVGQHLMWTLDSII